jgi:hypothetical protein
MINISCPCEIYWNLVFQFFIAIGTITVSILAVWGGFFKALLTPPKLKIVMQNIRGELTLLRGNGFERNVLYYHLKVINNRTWSTAKNCKVLLTEVHLRLPNQQFQINSLNAFHSFVWTPAEINGFSIDISHEQTFDFGRIIEGSDKFEPLLISYPNNFNGYIFADNVVRYTLKIVAEGYMAKKPQIFEVAWNGNWSNNLEIMSNNLTISEVIEKKKSWWK